MAGLADLGFEDESRTIKLPSGKSSFTVSGLSVEGIARLIKGRASEMEDVFAKFMQDRDQLGVVGDPKFARSVGSRFGQTLLDKAPRLAADIIAIASGEPHAWENAQRLPFTVQIEALEAVVELTFNGEEGSKKAMEALSKMVRAATSIMEDQNLSQIGSMDYSGMSPSS